MAIELGDANLNTSGSAVIHGAKLHTGDSSIAGLANVSSVELQRTYFLKKTQINNLLIDNLTLTTGLFQNSSIEFRHYTAASITKKNVDVGWWTSIESNIFTLEAAFSPTFDNVRNLQNSVSLKSPNLTGNSVILSGSTMTGKANIFDSFRVGDKLAVHKQFVDNVFARANQTYLDHQHNTITSTTSNIYFTGQGENNEAMVGYFVYTNGVLVPQSEYSININNGTLQFSNANYNAGIIISVDWLERRLLI